MPNDDPDIDPNPTVEPDDQARALTVGRTAAVGMSLNATIIPAIIADAGEHATRRFLEFFAATIRNKNTRMCSGAQS